jgi:PIN domain nuclease of toxin-antitoxin system
MRLLLDTHVWLWMQAAPKRLGSVAAERIADPDNEVLLSAASAWEIAIKYALGRLPLPAAPSEYVASRMARSGTAGLPVEHRHALHVATLPLHHRDPFDRLLVAQAQLEGLTIVTADGWLDAYDVSMLRVRGTAENDGTEGAPP